MGCLRRLIRLLSYIVFLPVIKYLGDITVSIINGDFDFSIIRYSPWVTLIGVISVILYFSGEDLYE